MTIVAMTTASAHVKLRGQKARPTVDEAIEGAAQPHMEERPVAIVFGFLQGIN
jgi:hypothetical protein